MKLLRANGRYQTKQEYLLDLERQLSEAVNDLHTANWICDQPFVGPADVRRRDAAEARAKRLSAKIREETGR